MIAAQNVSCHGSIESGEFLVAPAEGQLSPLLRGLGYAPLRQKKIIPRYESAELRSQCQTGPERRRRYLNLASSEKALLKLFLYVS